MEKVDFKWKIAAVIFHRWFENAPETYVNNKIIARCFAGGPYRDAFPTLQSRLCVIFL